jgi:inhibitor of growth protein 3
MDNLEDEVKVFFSSAKRMKADLREEEFKRIKSDYIKTLDDAEEKCNITSHMHELVSRYLTRLDQELEKFKNELEADNAGITEILERRSHELDAVPTASQPLLHPPPSSQQSQAQTQQNHIRKKYSLTAGAFADPLSRSLSAGPMTANGNSLQSAPTPPASQPPNSAPLTLYNASNAIAAAASQAIAATQNMASGRRTASLKASIDAITFGGGLGHSSFAGGFAGDGFAGTLGTFGLEASASSNRANKRIRSASQFHDSGIRCRSFG